jgi:hypothetical protein
MDRERSGAASVLRPLLFGDAPAEQWLQDAPEDGEPWLTFRNAQTSLSAGDVPAAVAAWRSIAESTGLESRQTLQAWHFLRAHGIAPSAADAATVLAAIAEVPVGAGLDVLAAYRDGSVRYLNHAGGATLVESGAAPPALHAATDAWLGVAGDFAAQVGAWTQPALPPLPAQHGRLMMLTPGGPRFGQGPLEQLTRDARAASYMNAATVVLTAVAALPVRGK